MKGTTNAQRNAIIDSTSAVDSLTLTKADGTTQKHTVSNIIPKDDVPTSGSSKFVTSGAIYTALDGKVSIVSGKGLSTNDYTTAEKSKVSNLPANANTTFATKTELTDALSSVYKYKGSVNTYGNLPSNATAGDVYNVVASYNGVPAGTNWAWNGSSWDALGGTVTGYVADTTTVNGKPLSSNVTLTAADVSAVPTSRTVNGKALSSDITLAASDVGALASGGTAARATADASGNVITSTYATKSALETGLAGKQNSLTFDSAPTSGSSNPVTSGGVYSAINTVSTSISSLQSLVANKQDKLTFDTTPKSGSSNPITSGGVYTAINNVSVSLPATGSSSKPIYINSSGQPTACSYSIGTAASYGVTTSVSSGSSSLVTSGAVYNAINSSSSSKFTTLSSSSLSSFIKRYDTYGLQCTQPFLIEYIYVTGYGDWGQSSTIVQPFDTRGNSGYSALRIGGTTLYAGSSSATPYCAYIGCSGSSPTLKVNFSSSTGGTSHEGTQLTSTTVPYTSGARYYRIWV